MNFSYSHRAKMINFVASLTPRLLVDIDYIDCFNPQQSALANICITYCGENRAIMPTQTGPRLGQVHTLPFPTPHQRHCLTIIFSFHSHYLCNLKIIKNRRFISGLKVSNVFVLSPHHVLWGSLLSVSVYLHYGPLIWSVFTILPALFSKCGTL